MAARASPRLPYPLPLDYRHTQRIERLMRRVGARYQGWGKEARGFFVDVAHAGAQPEEEPQRFTAHELFDALGAALAAPLEAELPAAAPPRPLSIAGTCCTEDE